MLRHILHLDRVAQVRLIRPIPFQTVAIGDLRPIGIGLFPRRELLENPLDHRLHRGKHIFLLDKRHLDIKLIEIGGRTVRPRVFITKTGRDLEITVKPRHHDQLLELLRRLRQRIEFPRMQPRRHQKIPRPLRAARGNDRRLKLVEPLFPHPVAHRAHHVGAQHHVAMQFLTPQIQKPIGQPGFLGIIHIAKHRHRQLIRGPEHRHAGCINLNLARRQLGIGQRGFPRLDPPLDGNHPLRPQPLNPGKSRRVAVRQHLRNSVMIAQIKEQHPTMIAHPMHPSGKTHRLAHIGAAKSVTFMAAIGVHHLPLHGGYRFRADTPRRKREVKPKPVSSVF